jgi:hypothetical protein
MKRVILTCIVLICSLSFLHAELKNGTFASGKQNWRGGGKADNVDGDTVVLVTLDKFNYTELSQTFKMPATARRIKVSLAAKASGDYVFNDKSHKISDVDFKPGSAHVWSALVHPKTDLHLRFKDSPSAHYQYHLFKLDAGKWTFHGAEFSVKKPDTIDLSIVFPPGTGTIAVTLVKAEEVKE